MLGNIPFTRKRTFSISNLFVQYQFSKVITLLQTMLSFKWKRRKGKLGPCKPKKNIYILNHDYFPFQFFNFMNSRLFIKMNCFIKKIRFEWIRDAYVKGAIWQHWIGLKVPSRLIKNPSTVRNHLILGRTVCTEYFLFIGQCLTLLGDHNRPLCTVNEFLEIGLWEKGVQLSHMQSVLERVRGLDNHIFVLSGWKL